MAKINHMHGGLVQAILAPLEIIKFLKTASPPPKRWGNKHRDPSVYPDVPPLHQPAAPIGQFLGHGLTSLVRRLSVESDKDVHEEARDKTSDGRIAMTLKA